MNNWIPKNKTLRFAIYAIIFSICLYFTGLFIVGRETKKIEDFYHDSESEFSKEERFLFIKATAESNKEPIQVLRNFFIQKGDEVEFIEKIEEVARNSGVEFEIVSIGTKSSENNSFEEDIEVKMGIGGAWKNIMNFADKLEKMPFGVLVKNVSLGAKAPGDWFGFIEFIVFREK